MSGQKPFIGDNIEHKICRGKFKITKNLFPNISNSARDMIIQLLTIDYNMRFDLDQVLKHIWFEKDILMKQKVNDLITEFSIISKSNNLLPSTNKENVSKKTRFCPCIPTTCSSDP